MSIVRAPLSTPALGAVALLALGLAVPPLGATRELAAQVRTAPERAFPVHRDGRPFRHAEHQRANCGDCHRSDERHRSTRAWTPADCAACHHGEGTTAGCTSCHARADFAPARRTATPMALSVWAEPRVRELVFEHDRHRDVGCLDCHRGGMTRPPERCATCHLDHHRPEADCARCHLAPDPATHPLVAHLSCAGAGCHSSEATKRPILSRTSCIVCHRDQREHRPGRSCVACHVLGAPHAPPLRTGLGGSHDGHM